MRAEFLRRLNARLLPSRVFVPPEWLVLGVNNVCNLHCKMCDVGQANLETNFARNLLASKPLNMPMELMRRIVEQTSEHYPRARLGFAFTEPLLYPHLVEAVALARDHGLRSAVTTNGLTLKPLAPDLAAAGLEQLFLSIDGPAAVHDEIRGRQGAFTRALEGLAALLSGDRKPTVSVFCVITPWNVGRLLNCLEDLSRLPLQHFGFMHPNSTTAETVSVHNQRFGTSYPATTSNLGPFDPADVDLQGLLAEIAEIKARSWSFPVAFSPELSNLEQLQRFYLEPERFIGRRCNDVSRNLMIKSDGSAIPAHGRCYELTVGNLYEQSLPEIWNSPEIARFRRTLAAAGGLLPACSRCCSAF